MLTWVAAPAATKAIRAVPPAIAGSVCIARIISRCRLQKHVAQLSQSNTITPRRPDEPPDATAW